MLPGSEEVSKLLFLLVNEGSLVDPVLLDEVSIESREEVLSFPLE